MRQYRTLSGEDKILPFLPFMAFLEGERDDSLRLAEKASAKKTDQLKPAKVIAKVNLAQTQHSRVTHDSLAQESNCMIHNRPGVLHKTENCRNFLALDINEKYSLLKNNRMCFLCLKYHNQNSCTASKCQNCNENYHVSLCRANIGSMQRQEGKQDTVQNNKVASNSASENTTDHASLFPILNVPVLGNSKGAQVLFDGGSDCSYILHTTAKELKAKSLGVVTIDIVTMGSISNKYNTQKYKVLFVLTNGEVTHIEAYGVERITGPVSILDETVVKELFPYYDPKYLQRSISTIDILIGNNYFGLHPKEEIAKNEAHLSIMQGSLGICSQGHHPRLVEATRMTFNITEVRNVIGVQKTFYGSHDNTYTGNNEVIRSEFVSPKQKL